MHGRAFALGLGLAALVAGGCRSSNGSNPDGGMTGDGGNTEDVKIQDIQAATMASGTAVTIRGVVVVAVDAYGGSVGGVHVMEPEGGPYSGILVFASVSEAAKVAVGDLIDIEGGVKDEFTLEMDNCERASDCTLTEIKAATGGQLTLTKVGTGTVPDPEVLNPWDLAGDDSEAEKWESVLIRFENVSVLSPPYSVTQTDATLMEMRVTGPFRASSDLASLGTPSRGDCYASITGLGNYFFNYKIQPRRAEDLVTGGTGCPEPEEGDAMCDDGVDNDHNGYTDCEDNACRDSVVTVDCTTSTTVADIQNGTVAEDTLVNLENVVVTAIDFDREHLWVADAATGAVYNGVYVYRGTSATPLDASITVGSIVNVQGKVAEFVLPEEGTGATCGGETLTQIREPTVTLASGSSTPAPLTGLTVAELTGASAEMYEGTLVELANVKVVDLPDEFDAFSVGDATDKLYVERDIVRYTPTMQGECITIQGVMHYNAFAPTCRRVILPVQVSAGSCAP